ncbi:mucin-5AC [Drosophila albomicans]|uniref:Mucin-5AC n=1 Tax=Drosophila albomicans TaxID=7291 RepID=A0A9C6T2S8_DROAB|nr:mucin-5AC [Drosophila albomicans]
MTATATASVKTANRQDEVNVLAIVTPNVTATATATAAAATRLDPNNNNEWRPLGHGDPLQKDPTYDYSPPALERVRYWAENNASTQETRQQLPGDMLRNKTKSEVLLLGVANERDRLRTGQVKQSGAAMYSSKASSSHPSQSLHYSSYPSSQSSYYSSYPSHQPYSHPSPHPSSHPSPHPSSHPSLHPSSHSYAAQQSKYTGIRRSYYAPQPLQQPQHMPHTHLMPPPMMMKAQGLGMIQGPAQGLGMVQGQTQGLGMVQSQTQGHDMVMNRAHGPNHVEYRHSVMNSPNSNSYMSVNMGSSYSAPFLTSSPSTSGKPHYSSPSSSSSMATSSWYSSSPQHPNYNDAHLQETMQHYSFSRPQSGSSSPNAIHSAPRKPWLHELLQKELVKPTIKQRMKPTMPATKYLMGTTKPQHMQLPSSTYAPLTYAPITFVPGPPTIETPTTSSPPAELYITPHTTMLPAVTAGFRPITLSTTSSTTMRPVTTTTTQSSSRLMIPQTSNLAKRPTVAPAPELTTDALFSHYKQPPKPLLGPMYLIIEGHSKVKTYGQNELDPHSPKIVPVISKREPVVRIADPNEQRGTVETYQVKHLHTKTLPFTTTTSTTKPKTNAKATETNEKTPKVATTLEKSATLTLLTPKTAAIKTTPKSVATTTTTTTAKPTQATSSRPSISLRSQPTPSPSPLTNLLASPSPLPSAIPPLNPSFSPRPTLTPSIKPTPRPNLLQLDSPTTNTPPSGVHDLLSLLDNMFADAHEIAASSEAPTTTRLKPVVTKPIPQQPEPRIGSHAGSIESELQEVEKEEPEVKNGSEIATSTEPEQPPRATRQVFDYDQLPESRIKLQAAGEDELEYDEDNDYEEDEVEEAGAEADAEGELLADGELDVSEDETSDGEHNLLKRIDKFVDDVDDGDDDLEDLIEGLSPDDDDDNEDDDEEDQQAAERQQQQQQHKR